MLPHVPRECIGKSPNNAVTKHSIFFEIVTHFDQVLYLYVFGMKPKTNQCQSHKTWVPFYQMRVWKRVRGWSAEAATQSRLFGVGKSCARGTSTSNAQSGGGSKRQKDGRAVPLKPVKVRHCCCCHISYAINTSSRGQDRVIIGGSTGWAKKGMTFILLKWKKASSYAL